MKFLPLNRDDNTKPKLLSLTWAVIDSLACCCRARDAKLLHLYSYTVTMEKNNMLHAWTFFTNSEVLFVVELTVVMSVRSDQSYGVMNAA